MIFVVGNSRSGTTMLGRILGRSADVHTVDEIHFFERLVTAAEISSRPSWSHGRLLESGEKLLTAAREGVFTEVQPGKYREEVESAIKDDELGDPIALYRSLMTREARMAGKRVPCEHTPRYIFVADLLLEAYPDCRIIHVHRDPRDVLLSQKNRWRRSGMSAGGFPLIWTLRSWANYHPWLTARLWVSVIHKADTLRQHGRFFEVGYESIVREPEQALSEICKFLGISHDPEMMDVEWRGSSQARDDEQLRGMNVARVGAWRRGGLASAEKFLCEKVAAPSMISRGYEPAKARPNPIGLAWSLLTLPPKLFVAVLLNLGRLANPVEFFRRRFG
ncbi:sulfotransferase [Wenzhouxiangella sp. XN201]|uniref:sulfotransferase family protein n=1 Tax=Wenzhouxiangella sp. XN201 TaxID=2710755 RepID=UPI0013C6D362|nr:sulfotransferase [Wenzhouxiangella sp. XN201]NEZ04110.1 sulfotransferase [Wenzhouxiangella sp. XN201]